MEPELDPDRHLKKLALSFGVSNLVRKYLKNRPKKPKRTDEEIEAELLAKAKENREKRIASFGPIQRHIFGLVAKHYNLNVDNVVEGVADSDEDTDILNSFCTANGHSVIVFLYTKSKCPEKGNENEHQKGLNNHTSGLYISETGRYDPKEENLEMMRVSCTDGFTQDHLGSCAAVCRKHTDNDLDINTITKVPFPIELISYF